MIKKPVTIKHQNGLDVRPIALLVQEASQYSSRIYIEDGVEKFLSNQK